MVLPVTLRSTRFSAPPQKFPDQTKSAPRNHSRRIALALRDGVAAEASVSGMDQPNSGSVAAGSGLSEAPSAESESRFYEIADAAPVMIWISNANAACTWFNKVVLDFT